MQRTRTIWVGAACVLVSAVVFLAVGMWIGGHPADLPTGIQKIFVGEDQRVRAQVIDDIEDSFYKKVPKGQLEEASIKGIVASLHDPFSAYFTPKENKLFAEQLNSKFDGIGTEVAPDKRGLRIQKVYAGAPAARAGIHVGDLIVGVNGKSIAGVPIDLATARVRGPAGTSVNLTVLTPSSNSRRTVAVKRAHLSIPLVTQKLATSGGVKLGVVRLESFGNGAHGEVKKAVDQELSQGAKGIVLDLRGNGGGLLEEGVLVASVFVDKGLIVSTKGRERPEHKFEATGGAIPSKIPVAVLVDGGTASASEIVTGALRDHGRATIVGTKTFGKGVFQEDPELSNGGSLKITVGSYYLPDGENLAGHGIVPPVKAVDNPKTNRDEALPVALRTLAGKVKSGR